MTLIEKQRWQQALDAARLAHVESDPDFYYHVNVCYLQLYAIDRYFQQMDNPRTQKHVDALKRLCGVT